MSICGTFMLVRPHSPPASPPAPPRRSVRLAAHASAALLLSRQVEVVGGYYAHSLAIMSDAAHLLSDLGAFFVSLLTLRFAARRSAPTHSFGYHRLEVVGALFSVAMLWLVTGVLLTEAYSRIRHPVRCDAPQAPFRFSTHHSLSSGKRGRATHVWHRGRRCRSEPPPRLCPLRLRPWPQPRRPQRRRQLRPQPRRRTARRTFSRAGRGGGGHQRALERRGGLVSQRGWGRRGARALACGRAVRRGWRSRLGASACGGSWVVLRARRGAAAAAALSCGRDVLHPQQWTRAVRPSAAHPAAAPAPAARVAAFAGGRLRSPPRE